MKIKHGQKMDFQYIEREIESTSDQEIPSSKSNFDFYLRTD